ncbi:Cap15 family CBASS effector [Staphylococcus hominis]|uniref:Cap15 family cyclic dinucleotide receptor domain-containing protein n=1 Tax=Staphylococcus hominis TaxID=1290 RepID=UPI001C3DAAC7|nr:hypothetical protein [Staphylococcus hominis]MBV5222523.1 hypothetical protein [Staphylococcus hominis]
MHEYSVDIKDHKIIYYLSIASFFLSSFLSYFLNLLITKSPWNVISVSLTAMGVFTCLYALFDKHIWKWKILKKLGIIKNPNLNGVWEGVFLSSYHEFNSELPISLTIVQTWSKISIRGTFNHSDSFSNTASIKVNLGNEISLFYSYYNDKKPEYYNLGTSNHRGYANLKIKGDLMEGKYFNDPTNNQNWGKMKLKKVNV